MKAIAIYYVITTMITIGVMYTIVRTWGTDLMKIQTDDMLQDWVYKDMLPSLVRKSIKQMLIPIYRVCLIAGYICTLYFGRNDK